MKGVREVIGIDKVDLSGNLIFIEEQHNADANFIFHAIVSHCIDKKYVVCLILFHNTFDHFHNVGKKLGYDLKKDYGSNVRVVEPLKTINKNIQFENNAEYKDRKSLDFDIKSNNKSLIKQLINIIQKECLSVKKENETQKVYIILDNLNHLLDFGMSIQEIWLFMRYLRSFIYTEPLLTLCIASHVYKTNLELCKPNLIALMLRSFAELVINVQPLKTGYSDNMTGKMIISWKSHHERVRFKWLEEMIYLYKLSDRQVELFSKIISL